MSSLQITNAPEGELLSVDDAKRHLRLFDISLDDEVSACIVSGRDYCERLTNRTLRTAVTRTLKQQDWWRGECWNTVGPYRWPDRTRPDEVGLRLPWPPLLTVESVTYYDVNNASQTLSASNYNTEFSTDGGGRITWASNATIPALYFRPDAVTVTFTTGYADVDSLPPVALQAMKLAVEMFFTRDTATAEMIETTIGRLLAPIDWTGYA